MCSDIIPVSVREKIPEELRDDAVGLVPIFTNKVPYIRACDYHRGIELMSHFMKVWNMVVDIRLTDEIGK